MEPPCRRHANSLTPSSSALAMIVATADKTTRPQSIEQCLASNGDDTCSISESIRQHVVDGHLRYHAYHAGLYAFPNDETEQYRDDIKHRLTIHLCDGSYFYAPIHDRLELGARVLDLGTGTGRWCIELADHYPKSHFHGMDLSPIQPDWVPENVEFFVDDIEHENGWAYEDDFTFAYIHVRHTIHSIKNRPEMWRRIYEHPEPGGYVEVSEFQYVSGCDDNSFDGPYALRDFLRYLEDSLAALGSQLNSVQYLEDELLNAVFIDIGYQDLRFPVGPWPQNQRLRECGHMLRDVIMIGLQGLSRKPFRDGLGWTDTHIEMFLVNVRKDLSNEVNGLPKFHSYYPFRSIFGRKSLGGRQRRRRTLGSSKMA